MSSVVNICVHDLWRLGPSTWGGARSGLRRRRGPGPAAQRTVLAAQRTVPAAASPRSGPRDAVNRPRGAAANRSRGAAANRVRVTAAKQARVTAAKQARAAAAAGPRPHRRPRGVGGAASVSDKVRLCAWMPPRAAGRRGRAASRRRRTFVFAGATGLPSFLGGDLVWMAVQDSPVEPATRQRRSVSRRHPGSTRRYCS